MAGEEFVILLGDHQEPAAAEGATDEFVILLDNDDAPTAAPARLNLPALATVAQVNEAYQQLAELLSAPGDLLIAGAEVEQFDTAFAQLLLAVQRKCQLHSRACRIIDASPAMVAACRRLAVDVMLGIGDGGRQNAA